MPFAVDLRAPGAVGLVGAKPISLEHDSFVAQMDVGFPYAVFAVRAKRPGNVIALEFSVQFEPRDPSDNAGRFFWLEDAASTQGKWFTEENALNFPYNQTSHRQKVRVGIAALMGTHLRAFRLNLPRGGGRFELADIHWIVAKNPRGRYRIRPDADIQSFRFDGITREGIAVAGNSRIRFRIDPAMTHLQLSWASFLLGQGRLVASIDVGGTRVFRREVVDSVGPWRDIKVRLPKPDTTDVPIEVVFSTEGGGTEPSLVWGAPMALTDAKNSPAVLLVTLDTTRADHTTLCGAKNDTTPSLAAVASKKGSLRFLNHWSQSSVTTPSHASILTGRYPAGLGLFSNSPYEGRLPVIPERAVSLAELYRDAGYATAGFVSAAPVGARHGFSQGFDLFDEPLGTHRRGDETIIKAVDWLQSIPMRPVFLWLHLYDAHSPYDEAPSAFLERYAVGPKPDPKTRQISMYDGSIAFADLMVSIGLGVLVNRWGDAHTTFVATADHGESFGEKGVFADHFGLAAANLHVPLVLRVPERYRSGLRSSYSELPTENVDIFPTLLELSGLTAPEGTDGKTLLRGEDKDRAVFAWWKSSQSTVQQGWHLIRRAKRESKDFSTPQHARPIVVFEPGVELFDLAVDPREGRNRCDDQQSRCSNLQHLLQKTHEIIPVLKETTTTVFDETDHEKLRALGYVE